MRKHSWSWGRPASPSHLSTPRAADAVLAPVATGTQSADHYPVSGAPPCSMEPTSLYLSSETSAQGAASQPSRAPWGAALAAHGPALRRPHSVLLALRGKQISVEGGGRRDVALQELRHLAASCGEDGAVTTAANTRGRAAWRLSSASRSGRSRSAWPHPTPSTSCSGTLGVWRPDWGACIPCALLTAGLVSAAERPC